MSKYISIYGNNPTADKQDGTVISENGSFTSPLSVTLDATDREPVYEKIALRCASGYSTIGEVSISFEGTTSSMWSIVPDNNYTEETVKSAAFTSECKISEEITDKNKIFWVRANVSADEEPSNDKGVTIKLVAKIQAVE